MRLTYRRTIQLTLGRQETKLYAESLAYQQELQRDARDMADVRGLTVEVYLSSWGREDGLQLHAFTTTPKYLTPAQPVDEKASA